MKLHIRKFQTTMVEDRQPTNSSTTKNYNKQGLESKIPKNLYQKINQKTVKGNQTFCIPHFAYTI